MKSGIHPEYREVVFHDTTSDVKFITRSTINTPDTIVEGGKTYPLVKIEMSSTSHPFYTGKQKVNKSDGRVAKFNQRFGALGSKK